MRVYLLPFPMILHTHLSCLFHQDYKTYLDFVLAMENRKEPQVYIYNGCATPATSP